ncbi:MAG TPA: DUF1629 domain-containing protein [Gemmatimonadaceae bacterium]|jgi:hypothetical protein
MCFTPWFTKSASLSAPPSVPGIESWISGRRIDVPVPQPLALSIEPDEDDKEPDEPGALLELYQYTAVVMSDRLLNALREAGVDNLQSFDAVIRAARTGSVTTNYKVVNVVGVVAATDMSKSQYSPPQGPPIIDVSFDSLVIDERRARGQLLFRLAESLGAIIVHQRVKDHLLARNFDMLTFRDPAKYVS